jgi:hypothetical protein
LFLLAALSLAPAILLGGEPSKDADLERRKLLAVLMKEQLIPELAKNEIKAESSGRETTKIANPIKDIVIHTDWVVTANGRYVEPATRLGLEVTRLEPQPDGSRLVALRASCPIAGDVWGEIKTVGKTKVDFDATAKIDLVGKLRLKAGSTDQFEFEISEGKAWFDDVSVHPDLAGILSGKAREVANKVLDEQNAKLKKDANQALVKAAAEGKLRLGF